MVERIQKEFLTEEAIAEFRDGLTGGYALQLLAAGRGRLLIQLPVGVGKSRWVLRIIEHVLTTETEFDGVVLLLPRWDLIHEFTKLLPKDRGYTLLRPRPQPRCGDLDAPWQQLERLGCAHLAKKDLCGKCPKRRGCPWPEQYSDLRNSNFIIGTQHQLTLNPQFISHLKRCAQLKRPLVLVDESSLLLKDCSTEISQRDLDQFCSAVEKVRQFSQRVSKTTEKWLEHTQLLIRASRSDLREGRWRFPSVAPKWAIRIQEIGRQTCGDEFRFLGFNIQNFCHSDRSSRERLSDGSIRFATSPDLGRHFIIFSGSIAKELVRFRIDPNHRNAEIHSPFVHTSFRHPDTRWFNIRSSAGAAKYFPHNAPTILDFYAAKIARNIEIGKRTLLICRKKFRGHCAEYLTRRLAKLGVDVTIVADDWSQVDFKDPRTLPLINYGVCGLNLFEDFDAAYCLTGYYVSAATLEKSVFDIDAPADRFPISIVGKKNPPLRLAKVDLPDDRATNLPMVAQMVLQQIELDTVIQAIGRVRLFTRSREIITFQADDFGNFKIDREFASIADARTHFNIPTRRSSEASDRVQTSLSHRESGLKIHEIAARTGQSISSVKRHLRQAKNSS